MAKTNNISKRNVRRILKKYIDEDFYTIDRKNRWITNELSRGRVHLMRATHDCIMTSSNTISGKIINYNETYSGEIIFDENIININNRK